MSSDSSRRILGAVERLRAFDRAGGAALLEEELRLGASSGERWKSVHQLAAQIGEIEIALEAARRYAGTEPLDLGRLIFYWGELAAYDRAPEALEEIEHLPLDTKERPELLHFVGTLAAERGEFERAEECYRKAIAGNSLVPQVWFALAMTKTFKSGDPDLKAMESLLPGVGRLDPLTQARFLYGLAQAYHDCGEHDRAWLRYSQGANLRRGTEPWDRLAAERLADSLISSFTAEAASRLLPPRTAPRRALFVNGLPRSGTTLVEQLLTSHSQVEGGGEINLLRAATIPAGDRTMSGALAYQERHGRGDPWGDLAEDYFRMLEMRVRTSGLVVDKTLGQSFFMGLLLHMLPDARVIWVRRDPQDVALSCFRTFFTSKLPWSWALEDIAHHFNIEDRLFAHWREQFPDRMLIVPYEQMVQQPEEWIPRILLHAGLEDEAGVREFHRTSRAVRTASVSQVRQPISTARIGLSKVYDAQLEPFRRIYRQ